ncbi:SPOSA6832_02177, partial [Sporobolomyces salmonicolor]
HLLSWLPLSSRLLAPLTASNAFDTAYQPSHDLEQWIERERVVAVDQLFGNIGDVVFTWTRDANLIASGLLEVLPSPSQASDTEALSFFSDYIDAQLTLQHLPNPSGTCTWSSFPRFLLPPALILAGVAKQIDEDLTGLGEPKFHANLTVFEGRWGRPQRDGPALRALAVLQYAEYQSARGQLKEVAESKIVKLLKADLDYVAAFWNCTTFDLWEETLSSSFFTTLSHFHALSRGSAFFSGERGRKYENEAKKVRCFLGEFWVEKEGAEGGGWWRSNWNVENGVKRSGLDANSCALLFPPLLPSYVDCPFFSVLGALLHPSSSSSPSSNPCDSQRFGPCSDRMLANHLSVVESFRGLYPINTAREAAGRGRAIAVGSYGGNPWYLTTLAAASQLYRALSVWTAHGELNVTNTSLPFFRNLLGEGAMVGRWKRGEEGFGKVLDAVRAYADELVYGTSLEIVREYTPEGGALAEQFDEHSGEPRGARDLTWCAALSFFPLFSSVFCHATDTATGTTGRSYIAFLTAAHARSAFLSAAPLPSPTLPIDTFDAFTCPDGGDYAGSMKVKFEVEVQTQWGEAILLTGSAPSLGSWDPSNALALSAHDYTRDRPVWTTDSRAGGGVGLPGRRGFEFKFIKRKLDGTLVWEGGENRVVYTSSGGERTVSVKWHG